MNQEHEPTSGHGPRPPLRRERRAKVIAGVCTGLGRHFDIDPVVFRVLFAVLAFVGGLGLLAYAAAWLLMPQDDGRPAVAQKLMAGSNPLPAVLVVVGLGIGTLASFSALTQGLTGMWPVVLLGAAAFGVLMWRGDIKVGRPSQNTESASAGRAPTWWQQPVGEQEQNTETAGPASGAAEGNQGAEPTDAVPPEYAAGDVFAGGVDLGKLGGAGTGIGSDLGSGSGGRKVERQRQRGYGGLVLACMLAGAGVLGVLSAAGAVTMSWTTGTAVVLVMLGAGMVIGGLFGKTTGLVPVGLVIALPLLLLTAIGVSFKGGIGDESWTPASAAALQPDYAVGVGDAQLDLSNVKPGAGHTVTVKVDGGIGDLQVSLPANVTATVHVHDGIGQLNTTGTWIGGGRDHSDDWNVNEDFTIPSQGPSQGTIVLNVSDGIGDVEVYQ